MDLKFAPSLITVVLAAFGADFETALILSVAALTTTGPLVDSASQTAIDLGILGAELKMVLAAAMVVGRLETLAIIALITPDLWRD